MFIREGLVTVHNWDGYSDTDAMVRAGHARAVLILNVFRADHSADSRLAVISGAVRVVGTKHAGKR
jgi:hypothetical protein